MADELKQEEATTPEPEYNAASALADLESEDTEETPAVTADEDETEEETEESDVQEDQPDDDNDDEEDDDLTAKLALDESIADKLPEDARKRYEQQVKGLAKKEKQLLERAEAIATDEKGYQVYQSYADAFSDPQRAWDAYKALGDNLTKLHGEPQTQPVVVETDNGYYTYDGKTFASEMEIELYKEVQSLKTGNVDPEIEEIKAERKARKETEALNAWVDGVQPRITAKVAAKTGGWGVTKEQIAQVAKLDKQLLDSDPVTAMKRYFPDEYADFKSSSLRPKKPVKDMIDSTSVKGFKIPDNPDDYNAAHALMELTQ